MRAYPYEAEFEIRIDGRARRDVVQVYAYTASDAVTQACCTITANYPGLDASELRLLRISPPAVVCATEILDRFLAAAGRRVMKDADRPPQIDTK